MAVTQNSYTGNGSTTTYAFTFPYLKSADIKAQIDATDTTAFTLPTATTLQFNTAPANGAKIKIYRKTDDESLTATFYAGSSIKSEDLNDNFTQNLYTTQEVNARYLSNLGGTMVGDLAMGEDAVITFEGATDDANETTLTVADPTADRTITLPNETGTVITTGSGSVITSSMITDGTIVAADIANDTITATQIAANAITSSELADSSVDTSSIASGAITNVKIGNAEIQGAKLANDTITATQIAANAIGSSELADNAVDNAAIAADAVNGAKIADDSIDSEHYVADSIDTEHYAANSVDTAALANDCVTSTQIADDSIDSEHYVADSIDTEHYAPGSVDGTAIANDAISSQHMAANSVDSDQYVDGSIDLAHMSANSVDSDQYVDGSIDRVHLEADIIDSTKLADNAVQTEHIADGHVTLPKLTAQTSGNILVGNGSNRAESVAMSGDVAIAAGGATTIQSNSVEIGMIGCEQTTISDSDSHIPTSGAVVDYVAAQIAPIGGLEVIADEDNFPSTQPASGVVISIADAAGVVINGSGVSTTARTAGNGSDNVTINGFPSSLYSETLATGNGLMVTSTGSSNTYNYHKLLASESDVKQLSDDINDFNARYRVNAGEPGSNNDEGDLVYDTNANKMKVYDSSTSAWKEVTSTGDFKYLFLCPAGGTGAPTINGSIATYDLRESSNSGSAASVTSAAQLLVSINGVVQKANTGTSAPTEGFALVDANTIIFSNNLPSGASVFIIQFGSALTITTPGDDTVSAAKIQTGAVSLVKMASESVDEDNLYISNAGTNGQFLSKQSGNNGGLTWATPTDTNTNVLAGGTITGDVIFDNATNAGKDLTWDMSDNALEFTDDVKAVFGAGTDLSIYHDGSHSYISESGTGGLKIKGDDIRFEGTDGTNLIQTNGNNAIELKYGGNKKAETASGGFTVTGTCTATDFAGDGSNLTGISGTTINNNADNKIITGSGTAGTLEAEANLTYDGTNLTITNGSYYVGTSGHGLDFSLTGQQSGMTSERLDNYEEGTFTVEVQNGWGISNPGYAHNTCRYTLIGRLVHCFGRLQLNAGSDNGNQIYITGFPFVAANWANQHYPMATGFFNSAAADGQHFAGYISPNSTYLYFYKQTATTAAALNGDDVGDTFDLMFSITYQT